MLDGGNLSGRSGMWLHTQVTVLTHGRFSYAKLTLGTERDMYGFGMLQWPT